MLLLIISQILARQHIFYYVKYLLFFYTAHNMYIFILTKGEFDMEIKEKLNILKDLLDIDQDTLSEETELDQLSEWDSIASITTIAMFDSQFGKEITSEEVKGFKTIKDITDKME